MKKNIFAAALLLTGTPAFATTNPTTNLSGPYLGIYGGYDWTDADNAGATTDINGWDTGVFAGYKIDKAMDWTQGYVFGGNAAIEGFYGISNADGAGIEKDDEWGISFRPGLSILDSVISDEAVNPYLILGYRNTKLDGVVSERYDGFELGVGTEVVAFGNAGLRVDYSHTWYDQEGPVDLDSNDVRLGLSYHF